MRKVPLALVALVASALVTAVGGCEREKEIRTYRAPKDAPPPAAIAAGAPPDVAAVRPPPPGMEVPTWTVPPGWTEVPSEQTMRLATFQVSADEPTAILTVSPLGQEAGDILPNVNRWEGQLGLPPTGAADLPKLVQQVDVNGVPATTVHLRGEQQHMLAAILPHGPRVWFVKLTGTPATIEEQKPGFDAFVTSIRFDHAHGEDSPPTQPAESRSVRPIEPKWALPAGWVAEPERPMRFATLKTSADPGAAEIVISSFTEFGGLVENINRWRNMVGLDPVTDVSEQPAQKIAMGEHEAALFDMTGPAAGEQPARRLVLAMVPAGQSVWFFRMTGSADVVEQHKAAFDAFLQSVRFE